MTTQNNNKPFSQASPVRAVRIAMIVSIILQAVGAFVILSILSQSNWFWGVQGVTLIVLGASLLVTALVVRLNHRVE